MLFNADDVVSTIKINPDILMRILESLYFKGWSSYPKTRSRWVSSELLKGCEKALRRYNLLKDDFTWRNYANPDPEEAGRMAIVLTPSGIEALLAGGLKGEDRLVAMVLLNQMISAFAPKLKWLTSMVALRNMEKYAFTLSEVAKGFEEVKAPLEYSFTLEWSRGS